MTTGTEIQRTMIEILFRRAIGRIETFEKLGDYDHRNQEVYCALSQAAILGYGCGVKLDPQEPDWPVVYIELPTGQDVSVPMFRHGWAVSRMDGDLLEQDWYDNGTGYAKRQAHLSAPNGYLHRIVAERMFGAIPEGYEVDHIDRNPSNNLRSNLRLATPRAQKLNQSRISVRQRKNGRWQAMYGEAGKSLGMADTREEAEATCKAHRARLIAECHKNGEFITWKGGSNQVSWHVPAYAGEWDRHTTEEKYRRCRAFAAGEE